MTDSALPDFEKLGAFYLGRQNDSGEDPLLYDAKDLTTHGVIVGMTGSGKTGLGVVLLEEALIDRIPVIAIDPKGDLANLLLTFPELKAGDFQPWVRPDDAQRSGMTIDEYAADRAQLWRKGLAGWGQSGERIQKLRDSAEFSLFTPGSNAGSPLSVLGALSAPDPSLIDDQEFFAERINSTASSLLGLIGADANPLQSTEHILIANLLDYFWRRGQTVTLQGLIQAIQQPPFEKLGVMEIDAIVPPKARGQLAMQVNALLASPGFELWLNGPPIDVGRLLYTDGGKPRLSIISIAHLAEHERHFTVTLLLNEVIAWMRRQPGTGGLRALVYMDEIAGYLPPTANPPPKAAFLTLMKQARAFGVGMVVATQNPIDLDYKALSNAGTWFVGRLQTERDRMRLLDGLGGGGAATDVGNVNADRLIADLEKREFLLHNVHEDRPVVFQTRWAMSFLAGPLTRAQIQQLVPEPTVIQESSTGAAALPLKTPEIAPAKLEKAAEKPVIPGAIKQYYLPLSDRPDNRSGATVVYHPCLIAAASVGYHSARYDVATERNFVHLCEFADGPVPVDWDEADELPLAPDELDARGLSSARFEPPPSPALAEKNYPKWERAYKRWLRQDYGLTLLKSAELKMVSRADETEAEFRGRLQAKARELRDLKAEKLRRRYAPKLRRLDDRVERAEQTVDKEERDVSSSKLSAVLSFGQALLGAFTGRKTLSSANVGRASRAARSASRVQKEKADIEKARRQLEALQDEREALARDFQVDLDSLETLYTADNDELEPVLVRPKTTDIQIYYVALGWHPITQPATAEPNEST